MLERSHVHNLSQITLKHVSTWSRKNISLSPHLLTHLQIDVEYEQEEKLFNIDINNEYYTHEGGGGRATLECINHLNDKTRDVSALINWFNFM